MTHMKKQVPNSRQAVETGLSGGGLDTFNGAGINMAMQASVTRSSRILSVVALILGLLFVRQVQAFDNEPTGFRDIEWGADAAGVEGMRPAAEVLMPVTGRKPFGDQTLDKARLLLNPKEQGADYLRSYSRDGDKVEFAGVRLMSVIYTFIDGRFLAATMTYVDQAAGKGLGPMPPNYNAKSRVDRALEKYFGRPSVSPNPLFKFIGSPRATEYQGDATRIESKCDGNAVETSVKCVLLFISTVGDKELLARVSGEVAKAQQLREERATEAKRQRDELKARADY